MGGVLGTNKAKKADDLSSTYDKEVPPSGVAVTRSAPVEGAPAEELPKAAPVAAAAPANQAVQEGPRVREAVPPQSLK